MQLAGDVDMALFAAVQQFQRGLPVGAAVTGGKAEAIGAHDHGVLAIDALDIEERLVRALHLQATGVSRLFRVLHLAGQEDPRCGLPAVQLLAPVLPAIHGLEDHSAMTDCPAGLRIGEAHPGQGHGHRHAGLLPAPPLIVGIHHMTAHAHRHQALTGHGDGAEHGLGGQRRRQRLLLQGIRHLLARRLIGRRLDGMGASATHGGQAIIVFFMVRTSATTCHLHLLPEQRPAPGTGAGRCLPRRA
ncbi:hypothetical protein D3C80_688110 [compost metagenome]